MRDEGDSQVVQVFLCYARLDHKRVSKLYDRLLDAGFKPWMDTRDILPGELWKVAIHKAILRSDFFVVCLSEDSVNRRGQIQREIKTALDVWQEKLESDIYLIPVRLDDCEVPEDLTRFQWVDFFPADGWTRLAAALQAGRERRRGIPELVSPEETDKVQVLLADDHPVSREGMQRIIEHDGRFSVVGVVRTGPEVLPQVRHKRPDIVLLDLKWHGNEHAMDDTISQILLEAPGVCVIALTAYEHLREPALAAGARWALSKDIGTEDLLRIMRAVSD